MDEILDTIYSFFTEAVTHLTPAPVDKPIDARYLEFLYWVSTKWLLMAAGVFLLIILLYEHVKPFKKTLNWILDNCLVAMILAVWVMGFITYTVGAHIPNENHFFDVAPMAMIHATEMFLSMSDISAIHSDCYNSARFMTLFNLSHFFAITLSLVFVIKKFGHNLIARAKLWMVSWGEYFFGLGEKDVFVFWGLNDASFNLAKNTIVHLNREKNNKYYIVFVRTPESNDEEDNQVGISRIFNMSSLKNREIARLRELKKMGGKVYSTSSYQRLSLLQLVKVNNNKGHIFLKTVARICGKVGGNSHFIYKRFLTLMYTPTDDSFDVIGGKLRLKSLIRLLGGFGKRNKLHIFFLGNDHDSNIAATINMLKDNYVKNHKVDIYCNARKCAKTHWMECYEYTHLKEDTQVHIIDTSYLSVVMLKSRIKYHPVNHIEIDKETGLTESAFNSMVIGFGGTGMEAVKFLYEFGAFVKHDDTKSDFHCTVIDENMENLNGFFYTNAPDLKDRNEIELVSCKLNGTDYWNKIESIMPNLNYVVISLGDNDIVLDVVANLCSMAIRWRNTQKKLSILVRAYNDSKKEQLDNLCKKMTALYKDHNISVESFGSKEDIFTYEYIVDDKIINEAKEYNFEYSRVKPIYPNDPPLRGNSNDQWKQDLGIEKVAKSIDKIEEIEYYRDQNISNSQHAATKIHILEKCGSLETPREAIVWNVAKVEHERWNAHMRIHGWRTNPEHSKNFVKKLHQDICSWNDIRKWDKAKQKDTQKYDYIVVTTSLQLEKQNTK